MSLNPFKRKKEVKEVRKTVTTSIRIMYAYKEVSNECKNPFCIKMVELNRLYTRQDIQSISARLGYSVWDHRGGEGCTHEWVSETVVTQTEK